MCVFLAEFCNISHLLFKYLTTGTVYSVPYYMTQIIFPDPPVENLWFRIPQAKKLRFLRARIPKA
jgi:hypothetical protein